MYVVATTLPGGQILKVVLLTDFFGLLHFSNLCPHSVASFDSTRRLTGPDLFFTKKHMSK